MRKEPLITLEPMSDSTYTPKSFSPSRQIMTDVLDAANRRHMIHGLIEVDVTKPRQRLQEIMQQTGESLSFTGFIIYCCARTVNMNRNVHAYRDWHNRLIIFEDADIATAVERTVEGQKSVIFTVIRAANRKSVKEIHQEIRQAQTKKVEEVQGN